MRLLGLLAALALLSIPCSAPAQDSTDSLQGEALIEERFESLKQRIDNYVRSSADLRSRGDELRREQINRLDQKIDSRVWTFGILFTTILAILTFFGRRKLGDWIKESIESKTSEKILDYLATGEVVNVIREKGEPEIERLLKDLEEKALERLSDVDTLHSEYQDALRDLETVGSGSFGSGSSTSDLSPSLSNASLVAAFRRQLASIKPNTEDYSPKDWLSVARAATIEGEYDTALEAVESSLRLNPNYMDAHTLRGAVFSMMKNPDEALKSYSHVIEKRPHDIDARLNRAEIMITQNQPVNALKDLEHVRKSDFVIPSNMIILNYLRGVALKITGGDTSGSDRILSFYLDAGIELSWSFEEIDSWLEHADLSEGAREYIETLTATVKSLRNN